MVLGTVVAVGGPRSATPPAGARLVFTSTRTGIAQLYALDPARPKLGQLTLDPGGSATSLAWARVAPDGRAIAVRRGYSSELLESDGQIGRASCRERV